MTTVETMILGQLKDLNKKVDKLPTEKTILLMIDNGILNRKRECEKEADQKKADEKKRTSIAPGVLNKLSPDTKVWLTRILFGAALLSTGANVKDIVSFFGF